MVDTVYLDEATAPENVDIKAGPSTGDDTAPATNVAGGDAPGAGTGGQANVSGGDSVNGPGGDARLQGGASTNGASGVAILGRQAEHVVNAGPAEVAMIGPQPDEFTPGVYFSISGQSLYLSGLNNFADDAAAELGGVNVTQMYLTGGFVRVRVA